MVKLVLFDADGVIQRPSRPIPDALAALLPNSTAGDQFLEAVFAAERPFLTGGDGFTESLQQVLHEHNSQVALEHALTVWTDIQQVDFAHNAIAGLQANNIPVGLATNQQRHRAAFMRDDLGYRDLFDHLFISCEMGVAKPDVAYFEHIASELAGDGLQPSDIAFIDDHPSNVDAAREAGLHSEVFIYTDGENRLREILTGWGLHH